MVYTGITSQDLPGAIMRKMKIDLLPEEQDELNKRLRSHTVSVRDQRRAKVILLAAQGNTQEQIASEVNLTRAAVGTWCRRFMKQRLAGLSDMKGRGRKTSLSDVSVKKVLDEVVSPPAHLGRFSCRTMAVHAGISKASVQRLWSANDIKPHVTKTFKLSNDKAFEQKFWDVIGLYLSPPEKALVLCCDEKTQIQALQRTQPGLPLGVGHIKTKTHDYYRNGTLTLFAALNYLEGKLITQIADQHRHQEWLTFLQKIDKETLKKLDIHIIADNYATHKHPEVKIWLDKHPRFHMHFTPTSSSWMNLVERFFRDLTDVLVEGSFSSVKQLSDSIMDYLAERNRNPKRYVWKAKGEDILRKIHAAREKLQANSNV
jgi:transposase